jgi:membrane protein DedA with SNARE-associated domain
MFEGLVDGVVPFLRTYGYAAVFVFLMLETAWILHFVPSEVVVPAVAAYLVTGPTTFVLFVALATVAAVLGSLLAYYLFGVGGESVLRKYGHVIHLPESELDRSRAWFRRWGEGLMFWGRVIPVVRTPISIPAGVAGMHRGKFVCYSAGGWLAYNTALVWLVYGGADGEAPIDAVVAVVATARDGGPLVLGVVAATALLAGIGWYRYDRSRGGTE